MNFLFAHLPDTNFKMTAIQLSLWQKNAIFECDCDNFINKRIELSNDAEQNRTPIFEAALNAAIEHYGLLPTSGTVPLSAPPMPQRHQVSFITENATDAPGGSNEARNIHTMDSIYDDAVSMALQTHGLQRNP